MDESRRQVIGQAARGTCHTKKLVAGLIVVISAMVFGVYAVVDYWPGNAVGKVSKARCDESEYFDARVLRTCKRAFASSATDDRSESAQIDADTLTSPNSAASDAFGHQPGESIERRASRHDRVRSYNLSPGHTVAELCSLDLIDKETYCRAESVIAAFRDFADEEVSPSAPEYKISGQVLTTDGAGLDGVSIVASPRRLNGKSLSKEQNLRFRTVTDSLGAYSLDGLPDGEYTIRSASHGPYQSGRIDVRTGVTYADLVVARNLVTVTEGQVFTDQGEPLEGVMVLPAVLGQPSVMTDDHGYFQLPLTLKPTIDAFVIRFERPGFQEQTTRVSLQQATASFGNYVSVEMQPVESWTAVAGIVSDSSGEPLAGRAVELRSQESQQTHKATTDKKGNFTFPFVEFPANYQLVVFGGPGHKDHQRTVHVSADMDALDVLTESYEFGEISGKLVNLDGMPVPDYDLVLRNASSRRPNALVSTDRYGNFEIPLVPAGQLVVASQSTPSILVQGLHLDSGDKLNVPLVLDWGQHEIRGLVLDTFGDPVPASRVILRWSHEAQGITTQATRRTASDAQGYFAFNNLGPGPHSLQVDAPGFRTVDIDHDLNRQGYNLTVRLN